MLVSERCHGAQAEVTDGIQMRQGASFYLNTALTPMIVTAFGFVPRILRHSLARPSQGFTVVPRR